MAAGRWVPIIGLLAVLSFVPGVLGHHCFGDGSSSSNPPESQFSTLAAPAAPSPLVFVALIVIPVAVVGGALALVRPVAVKATAGRWVATPDRWVWVPDQK